VRKPVGGGTGTPRDGDSTSPRADYLGSRTALCWLLTHMVEVTARHAVTSTSQENRSTD